MILEVTKVLKDYQSRNGNSYTMIHFKDPATGKFYITYVCPNHRNWTNWEKLLRVGKYIKNLHTYKDNIINADSLPKSVMKKEREIFLEGVRRSKMTPEELRQYYQRIGVFI